MPLDTFSNPDLLPETVTHVATAVVAERQQYKGALTIIAVRPGMASFYKRVWDPYVGEHREQASMYLFKGGTELPPGTFYNPDLLISFAHIAKLCVSPRLDWR